MPGLIGQGGAQQQPATQGQNPMLDLLKYGMSAMSPGTNPMQMGSMGSQHPQQPQAQMQPWPQSDPLAAFRNKLMSE